MGTRLSEQRFFALSSRFAAGSAGIPDLFIALL
jgi:hypothetical protein